MNRDIVKGTLDEVVGSAKSKAGELTGNSSLEAEGITQQLKGKVESAWGKTREAVSEAIDSIEVHIDTHVEVTTHDPVTGVGRDRTI